MSAFVAAGTIRVSDVAQAFRTTTGLDGQNELCDHATHNQPLTKPLIISKQNNISHTYTHTCTRVFERLFHVGPGCVFE